jgi:NitT/TauT family transport system substrate-binding protein
MSVFGTQVLKAVAVAALGMFGVASAANAADPIRIITTGKGSPLEWPLAIGMAKGFFKAHNVGIDVVSAPSTATAMQQVAARAGDIGVGGLTDPIRAIDHGAPLSILILETSVPPYSIWGKPTIKKLSELKGKTVIVGGAKDITRIYFERMAAPNGLKVGDYDLTYAGTTPARYAALSSGAVDAAILYPPASFKAPVEGYSNLGELADYVKDLPFTGYAVHTEWAKQHAAEVKGFLMGMNESVKWFYNSANRTEAIDIQVAASGAARGDVEQTYDYFTRLKIYPATNTMTPEIIAPLVKILGDAKELDGAADPKRFISPDINAMLKAAQ